MMTIKTQLVLLALVAGIVAPATAMDKFKFGGQFQGAGVAGTIISNALRDAELKEEAKKAQAVLEAQQAQEAANLKIQQDKEQAVREAKEAAEKAQAQEQARLDAEAEAARVKKALDEQATATTLLPIKHRPKGQSGRQKPSGKILTVTPTEELQIDAEVEKTEQVEPKAPAKVNVGKTYGINLGTLGAVKLKKTAGTKGTPGRPVAKVPATPVEVCLPAADKEILAQYTLLDAANQKLELVYSLRTYVENPLPTTKMLIMEYVKISKQLEHTPELAEALIKLFEAKDAASYTVEFEKIKTNILKVV